MRRTIFYGLGALLAATPIVSNSAKADVIEAGFPPPGGVTFAGGAGGSGNSGGKTNTYSNFNFSAFQDLYFGAASASAPALALDGHIDSSEVMGFSSFTGNTAKWTGTASFRDVFGTTHTIGTEFLLTLVSPGGAVFQAPPAGASNGADYHVTGDFQVNLQFLGKEGASSYQPINALYQGYSTPVSSDPNFHAVQTSFTGSFYYTPAAVDAPTAAPLPSVACGGIALLGAGAAGRLRRRFRRAK
jgi:hypothetical protein